jgi:ABC-type uncharacterized transport system ATPase subunit
MTTDARLKSQTTPRLELRGISKRYADLIANDAISLRVAPGEIHALLGENGAGKSTLVKIVYGIERPDAGQIFWNGAPVSIASPTDARRYGIGMVFQHFSLFDTLTVAQNIALALPGRMDLVALSEQVHEISHRYGLPVDPAQHVHTLSAGERQRVEIVRCLLQHPRLLIMDEPTSVLTPQAIAQLFETLRRLAGEGCSIVYISHKLDEIRQLCDTATVLRAGRVAGCADPAQATPESLARLMIGQDAPSYGRAGSPISGAKPVRLEVRGVARPARDQFSCALKDISVQVHAGEILGIAGISGNGQSELLSVLSGEDRLTSPAEGEVLLDNAPVGRLSPGARRRLGLGFVPEDRLGRGTVASLPLTHNALLTAHRHGMVQFGFIAARTVKIFASRCIEQFDVRGPGAGAMARTLSGGNLQKFVVGREILQNPGVLVVAQPTWGVDVGAAAQIRQALMDLANAGAAVLVVSEDLDELLTISDRLCVLSAGRLTPALPTATTNAQTLGLLMARSQTSATNADHPSRESDARAIAHTSVLSEGPSARQTQESPT